MRKQTWTVGFWEISCFILCFYIWLILFESSPQWSAWGNNTFSILGCLVATIMLGRLAVKHEADGQRWFFFWLACGTGSYLIAELIWTYTEVVLNQVVSFPGTPDYFYLLQIFFFLVAFLYFIRQQVLPKRLIGFIFDILIVMTVAMTYSWFFLMRPILLDQQATVAEVVVSFSYPLSDIILLFCAISLFFIIPTDVWRRRQRLFRLLITGLIIQIIADTWFLYETIVNRQEANEWIDPLFIAGLLIVANAGYKQDVGTVRLSKDVSRTQSIGKLFLPYALVLFLFGTMLLYAQRDSSVNGLMIGCGITIFLILIRQILMILNNQQLLRAVHQKTDALEESEERYKSLFMYHPDAVYSLDLSGRLESTNPSFERMTNDDGKEWIQNTYQSFLKQLDRREAHAFHFETSFQTEDGKSRLLSITSIPIRIKEKVVGVFGIGQDVTDIRANEQKIHRLAYFDPLTGALNRLHFEERLQYIMQQEEQEECMLCFIDLDDFKMVNDTFGHQVGDQLLKNVVHRLREATESSDIVARQGGDEFTIVLRDIKNTNSGRKRVQSILESLRTPHQIDSYELISSPSIGTVTFHAGTSQPMLTLLRQADLAMYQAKSRGGKRIVYFEDIAESASRRFRLESELPMAIEHQQLVLEYQPLVDTKSYRMVGVEGLIRWNHPEFGRIAPKDFIPLAEEAGMIIRLGDFVLNEGFRQAKRWQEAGIDLKLGLNVSMQQFHHPTFILSLLRLIEETGVNPARIDLEITEVSAIEEVEETIETMMRLKQMGFTISIDDFGTGYSSLSRLADFPIDTLKIPQEFVERMQDSETDHALISSIIHLAKSLRLDVVAEGVETLEQVNLLNQLACQRMQGYYFGKSMQAGNIQELYQLEK